jgi:hypothetical protein
LLVGSARAVNVVELKSVDVVMNGMKRMFVVKPESTTYLYSSLHSQKMRCSPMKLRRSYVMMVVNGQIAEAERGGFHHCRHLLVGVSDTAIDTISCQGASLGR